MNDKNKALKKFLQTVTPKKAVEEATKQQYSTNGIPPEKTICSQPGDSKKEISSPEDKKNAISAALKKRIIQELLQHEKGAQYCSSISNSTLEAVEDMIDIVTLSDGSILVRPKKQWRSNTAKKYEPTQRLQVIAINDKPSHMSPEYNTMIQGRKINVNGARQTHVKTKSLNPPFIGEIEDNSKPVEENKENKNIARESPLERRKKYWASNKILTEFNKTKSNFKVREIKSPPVKISNENSNPVETTVKVVSKKPESAIVVTQKEYTHHVLHPINIALRTLNVVISSIFKTKDGLLNANGILKYSRMLSLNVNKGKMNIEYLKSKENANTIKEKAFWYLCNVVNNENKITPPKKQTTNYKFFVGKGNNSMLVRSLLKQRWWWTVVDKTEIENANLVWTQLVSKRIMSVLPCLKKKMENYNTLSSVSTNDSHEEKKKDDIQIANHLENHIHISNKKALFYNLRNYFEKCHKNPFDVLPLTFHIKGMNDPELQKFEEYYNGIQKEGVESNIWILKPGEFSNRGNGIIVLKDLNEIKQTVKKFEGKRTTIVQKYIEKPLLISKRKFDIRCYGMMTSINGIMKGYCHSEGYLRTSSKEYSSKVLTNKFIHLTNDAVQMYTEDYGKYEPGNKLSYNDFQKYLDMKFADKNVDFNRDINSQIKAIITDSFRATYHKLDPNRRTHTFEIFGFDFMIDEDFKVYLIEVNTNPCLETGCPLLSRVIPSMLENAFR